VPVYLGSRRVWSGAPTLRVLARLTPLRLRDVGVGPAQVVLLFYFFPIFFSEI
jgi:hypothetical protein